MRDYYSHFRSAEYESGDCSPHSIALRAFEKVDMKIKRLDNFRKNGIAGSESGDCSPYSIALRANEKADRKFKAVRQFSRKPNR